MTPKKRQEETVTWISAPETLEVLEKVNGRPIHSKYLYILAKQNRLSRKQIDGRTYLYSKEDAEKIRIIERKGAGRKPMSEAKTKPKIPAVKPEAEAA
jgi:hypothetical protein